jgi:hypothetical protein
MAAFNKLVVKSYPRIASRETSDTKFWNKYGVCRLFHTSIVVKKSVSFGAKALENLCILIKDDGFSTHGSYINRICSVVLVSVCIFLKMDLFL